MLNEFRVKGFKNFKDEVVFNLGDTRNYEYNENCVKNGTVKTALLYGPNGSGKSNLGEAIFDIISGLTDKYPKPELYNPYLNLETFNPIAEFSYKFKFDEDVLLYTCKKSGKDHFIKEYLAINDDTIINYDYNKHEMQINLAGAETLNQVLFNGDISFVKYVYKNSNLNKNDKNVLLFNKFFNFVENMLLFRSLDKNEYIGFTTGSESISEGIITSGKLKELQYFLEKNGIFYKLKEDSSKKNIMCQFPFREINIYEIASNGTKSLLLFFYWYIKMQKVSFVFIDEFDAFYHSNVSKNIVKLLRDSDNLQAILTTHNTDIMTNDLLRPDCYYLLNNGIIKSLPNSTEKELRFAHNLQKMYKGGAFK